MLQSLKVIVFALFLSGPIIATAQTGTISGTITDSNTTEAIIGANVLIQGTQIGAATDIDGKFVINNVKPGTYNLIVSFVTYKTHIIPDILVELNKKTTIEVALVEDAQELNEVVVSGTRQIDTDYSLVSAIRESKLVVSGISAEQITRSQDRDAAQVVRRVPGVTLQEDRFVIVRGLASRYSNVMLNGVLAPSTEADSRAFSFDIIPSGLLDRMLIYKSGSAELPGDFAGSVVQVSTKSAVESNFTNFSFSTGYRQGTTFTEQQSQQRASTEWLGFDNGFRDLPKDAPSDYRSLGFNVSSIEAESRKFKNTWGLEQINSVRPDLRFNVDLGRAFDLGRFSISSINSINYSNTHQFNKIEFNRYDNYQDDGTSTNLFTYNDDQYSNNVRLGLLSNWGINIGPKSKIEFKNLYNRIGSTQTTIREGDNYLRTQYYRNYSLRYTERSIYSGQLEGKHELKENKSKLTWLVGYTSAQRNEPDWKRLVTARPQGSSENEPFVVVVPSSTSPSNAARFYQELDEYNLTNRLDFEYKFNRGIDTNPFELKAGYWVEFKDRSFAARQIGHIARDGFDPAIGSLPYNEIFDPSNVAYDGGHHIAENTKVTDSYTATNLLTAGYVSFNMPLSEKFRIIPGVRIEYNHQQLETAPGIGSKQVNNPITSILPSLNISYNLNTSSLIRLAYSKTVNRPEFREIAPFSFYDFDNQADVLGNGNLTIADIHNLDLRWEYYPTPAEFISAGVFYKFFNNPIETNIDGGTDNAVFYYNNADKAQNYGVEVEIRKSLAYTSSSSFLNNTSVVFNAAYIHSVINLVNDGTLVEKDERPMQGQSPYIINAGISYTDEKNGLQANIQYNVFGKRIAFVGIPGKPTWWEMPRNLIDLTVSKRIASKIDLRFGITDLLNSKSVVREDANLDNDLTDSKTNKVVRSTRNGQYFTLGLSLKL